MIISNAGLNIIKQFEGLRLKAYQDSVGVWTIGYGHTKNVLPDQIITQEQADGFLREDVASAESDVNLYLGHVGLSQNQFDALVSLVFNVGAGAIFTVNYNNGYSQGSRLFNLILLGKLKAAAKHFTDFIYAGGQVLKGLIRRREAERDLFSENIISGNVASFWSNLYRTIFD